MSALGIIGSWGFFTSRWDWFQKHASKHGNFSFWAGRYPGEGFRALYGGALASSDPEAIEGDYFLRRLTAVLKGSRLERLLPMLLKETKVDYEDMAARPGDVIDPWVRTFGLIFRLNLRTFACEEIADNHDIAGQVLFAFETIEKTGDSFISLTVPWFPTISMIRRVVAAYRLSSILKRVVAARKQSRRLKDDTLQLLVDQKDSLRKMTEFTLASLWAGQINTGINAAWMIFYLSRSPEWREKVRDEVQAVIRKHVPDPSLSWKDRLMEIPLQAWESEFPTIDMCLKDIIRLTLVETAFRRNWHSGGTAVPISPDSKEAIPFGAYAIYPINEVHYDPSIYPKPHEWDPARYSPERAEDSKVDLAWLGWGALRHPCMGMRFAKLEINIVTAFWVVYFDSETVDVTGAPTREIPEIDLNAHAPRKPTRRGFVKVQPH